MKISFRIPLYLPAYIFSICILELIFGEFVKFHALSICIIYVAISWLINFNSNETKFDKKLIPYFAFCTLYILSLLQNNTFYKTNISEIANMVIWTIFGIELCSKINRTKNGLELFLKYTSIILVIGSTIAVIMGLAKFSNIINNSTLPDNYYTSEGILITGSSLHKDYNIFSLGICFSLFFSLHLKNVIKSTWYNWFLIVYFSLSSSAIILSSSRRGALFLILTILFSIFLQFELKSFYKSFYKFFTLVLPAFTIVIFIFYVNFDEIAYTIGTSEYSNDSFLRILTIKNEFSGENERIQRWNYMAEVMFDYNIIQLIFGGGFDYLTLFGRKFGKAYEDHPHNFFISTFLYGGLLSTFILLWLFFKIFYFLILQNGKYLFFLMLIFMIIFGLTSSNTLFTFRLFPVLSIIALTYINE